eukprot:4559133-Pleurochrysis_carterae.AAC.4
MRRCDATHRDINAFKFALKSRCMDPRRYQLQPRTVCGCALVRMSTHVSSRYRIHTRMTNVRAEHQLLAQMVAHVEI